MSIQTYEGYIKDSELRLNMDVPLEDGAQVYLVVTGKRLIQLPPPDPGRAYRIGSPRLARAEDAKDFVKEIRIVEKKNANL